MLFPALKRRLDQQAITHRSAGEFLDIMKTLMAKLKVGVISQQHRMVFVSLTCDHV